MERTWLCIAYYALQKEQQRKMLDYDAMVPPVLIGAPECSSAWFKNKQKCWDFKWPRLIVLPISQSILVSLGLNSSLEPKSWPKAEH